ncbi:hypothetical protein MMA231_04115 (plasmid) [Asticcacaulis sp. MM231]|uniref:hypothetical protein n=1 Tax=Asticcacaulis sp. MM231 TaxID=3157666 RepID=UPI0032D5AC5F
MSLVGQIYGSAKKVFKDRERQSNLRDTYKFVDRKKDSDTVVIVLAGYKQPLYPFVFPRLHAAMPEGVDVCVMSAGKHDPDLEDLCQRHSWSYLATSTNDVSLVQNVATSLHPKATQIVKIDEDMFVTRDTIRDCIAYYAEVKASGIANPAFVAPMININGVCYRPLLKQLGLLEEFEAKFGVARITTLGAPLTDSAEAARWMWEKTAPLEKTVQRLKHTAEPELMAPVQFSIGMIVMERAFWEEIGFYPVRRHMLMMKKSTLGADEEYLCRMATFHARPVVICQHALAGHFSFGRQYAGMLDLLTEHPEYF